MPRKNHDDRLANLEALHQHHLDSGRYDLAENVRKSIATLEHEVERHEQRRRSMRRSDKMMFLEGQA